MCFHWGYNKLQSNCTFTMLIVQSCTFVYEWVELRRHMTNHNKIIQSPAVGAFPFVWLTDLYMYYGICNGDARGRVWLARPEATYNLIGLRNQVKYSRWIEAREIQVSLAGNWLIKASYSHFGRISTTERGGAAGIYRCGTTGTECRRPGSTDAEWVREREPPPDFLISSWSLSSIGEGCPGQPAVQTGGCPGRVALSSYVGLLCFAQFSKYTQTPVCAKIGD